MPVSLTHAIAASLVSRLWWSFHFVCYKIVIKHINLPLIVFFFSEWAGQGTLQTQELNLPLYTRVKKPSILICAHNKYLFCINLC